jgi:hypothetical protein
MEVKRTGTLPDKLDSQCCGVVYTIPLQPKPQMSKYFRKLLHMALVTCTVHQLSLI